MKTQGSLSSEAAALVLLFSLVASGQIKLHRIDGWRKIATRAEPADSGSRMMSLPAPSGGTYVRECPDRRRPSACPPAPNDDRLLGFAGTLRRRAAEERSVAILRQCRRAMPTHGKLLVVELVLPSGEEPFFGKGVNGNSNFPRFGN